MEKLSLKAESELQKYVRGLFGKALNVGIIYSSSCPLHLKITQSGSVPPSLALCHQLPLVNRDALGKPYGWISLCPTFLLTSRIFLRLQIWNWSSLLLWHL